MSLQIKRKKRGLGSASEQTRKKVAKLGANAPHKSRGLAAAPPEARKEIATQGGLALQAKSRDERGKEQRVLTEFDNWFSTSFPDMKSAPRLRWLLRRACTELVNKRMYKNPRNVLEVALDQITTARNGFKDLTDVLKRMLQETQ